MYSVLGDKYSVRGAISPFTPFCFRVDFLTIILIGEGGLAEQLLLNALFSLA